jgi:steroid 5-alpha reductase family enzyme
MNLAEIAALLGLTLCLSLAAMTAAWVVAWRTGRCGFIDGVWPLVMLLTAGATFLIVDGDPVRKALLLWLTGVWAAREAWRGLSPRRRREADARYARAFAERRGWRAAPAAPLLLCFLPQGALAWLTALPAQLGQVTYEPGVGWPGWSGAVLAVVGLAVAGLGDLRPAMFPGEPSGARGVGSKTWRRWLERPDHVGDLAVWWGLFLIAAETGPGRWAIVGPVFLTLTLAHWAKTENPRRVSDGG